MKKCTFVFGAILLLLNAGAQNVGIGTTAPAGRLTVAHTSNLASPTLLLYDSNALNYSRIQFQNASGSKFWHIAGFIDNVSDANSRLNLYHSVAGDVLSITGSGNVGIRTSNPSATLTVNGNVKITDGTQGAGKVLTSDAGGNASWQAPAHVGFRAELSAPVSLPAGGYAVVNYSEAYDDGNGFNPATGVFTAPSAGLYHFTANFFWGNLPAGVSINYTARINVETVGGLAFIAQTSQVFTGIPNYGNGQIISGDYKLAAGDKVHLEVSHNHGANLTLNANGSATTRFSGFKVY